MDEVVIQCSWRYIEDDQYLIFLNIIGLLH
jgi:hypothetical protein